MTAWAIAGVAVLPARKLTLNVGWRPEERANASWPRIDKLLLRAQLGSQVASREERGKLSIAAFESTSIALERSPGCAGRRGLRRSARAESAFRERGFTAEEQR